MFSKILILLMNRVLSSTLTFTDEHELVTVLMDNTISSENLF